jgi:hypothetical protein
MGKEARAAPGSGDAVDDQRQQQEGAGMQRRVQPQDDPGIWPRDGVHGRGDADRCVAAGAQRPGRPTLGGDALSQLLRARVVEARIGPDQAGRGGLGKEARRDHLLD